MGAKIVRDMSYLRRQGRNLRPHPELPEDGPEYHSNDPKNEEFEPIEVAGYELMTCVGGQRRARHEEVFAKLRQNPISAEAVYKIQKLLREKGYYMLDQYQLARVRLADPRHGNKELLAAYDNSRFHKMRW
jgi:hypothetical protein